MRVLIFLMILMFVGCATPTGQNLEIYKIEQAITKLNTTNTNNLKTLANAINKNSARIT